VMDLQQVERVPETVLHRRKVREKVQAQRTAEIFRQQRKKSATVDPTRARFRTPESIIYANRALIRNEKIANRLDSISGDIKKSHLKFSARSNETPALATMDETKKNAVQVPKSRVLFALRLGGASKKSIPLRQLRILYKLRLRVRNSGVFLKLNHTNMALLRKVGNYVTFGIPSVELVRKLLQTRGFVNVLQKEKDQESGDASVGVQGMSALCDNRMVEEVLGDYGLVCVEDMVQELASGGEHFDAVSEFLLPFRLTHANSGFAQRRLRPNDYLGIQKGGKMGFRGENIDQLLKEMT